MRAQVLNAEHWYYEDAQPQGSSSTGAPAEGATQAPAQGEATPAPEETEGQ